MKGPVFLQSQGSALTLEKDWAFFLVPLFFDAVNSSKSALKTQSVSFFRLFKDSILIKILIEAATLLKPCHTPFFQVDNLGYIVNFVKKDISKHMGHK